MPVIICDDEAEAWALAKPNPEVAPIYAALHLAGKVGRVAAGPERPAADCSREPERTTLGGSHD
jgi:hypothetical protein